LKILEAIEKGKANLCA